MTCVSCLVWDRPSKRILIQLLTLMYKLTFVLNQSRWEETHLERWRPFEASDGRIHLFYFSLCVNFHPLASRSLPSSFSPAPLIFLRAPQFISRRLFLSDVPMSGGAASLRPPEHLRAGTSPDRRQGTWHTNEAARLPQFSVSNPTSGPWKNASIKEGQCYSITISVWQSNTTGDV